MTVVTTAPTYLFWRCAPPELRVPRDFLRRSGGRGGRTVAVGPHGSATPEQHAAQARRRRRGARRVRGGRRACWPRAGDPRARSPSIAFRDGDADPRHGRPGRGRRFTDLPRPALAGATGWRATTTTITASTPRRRARAPRSRRRAAAPTTAPSAPRSISATTTGGATSRRCWRRSMALIAQGVEYLYFIDEIFLPQQAAAGGAGRARPSQFGVQTRIDLWKPEMLDLLGAAGCVSIEAGVESLTVGGPRGARQECRHVDRRAGRPADLCARARVPFVQANLIEMADDDRDAGRRLARAAAGAGRLGQRSGAALSLSELAGLPPPLGRAGRPPGSGRTPITSASSTRSATSRTSSPGPLPELEAACLPA